MPPIGIGHSWEPDDSSAFEQDACKEVQIEDHFPVGPEPLARQSAAAIADRWTHNEVAAHERLDSRLAFEHERPVGLRLEEALRIIDERKTRPPLRVDDPR